MKPESLSPAMQARVVATLATLGLILPPSQRAAAPAPAPAPLPPDAPAKPVKPRKRKDRNTGRPRGRPTPDLTGQRFAAWLVLERAPSRSHTSPTTGRVSTQARWLCRCLCGRESVVSGAGLRDGASLQCRPCASRKNAPALRALMAARRAALS